MKLDSSSTELEVLLHAVLPSITARCLLFPFLPEALAIMGLELRCSPQKWDQYLVGGEPHTEYLELGGDEGLEASQHHIEEQSLGLIPHARQAIRTHTADHSVE